MTTTIQGRMRALLVATALIPCLPYSASAQSVWSGTSGNGDNGNWGTAGHWNPNGVPNATGAEVIFNGTPPAGAAYTINLAASTFAIGALRLQSDARYVIGSTGGAGTLNFQAAAGNALLEVTNSNTTTPLFARSVDTVSPVNVNLTSDLDVMVAANQFLWFGDATTITGGGDLRFTGPGTVRMDGTNTYTGETHLIAGAVDLHNLGAFGSNFVRFTAGTLRTSVSGTLSEGFIVQAGGASHIIAANGTTLNLTGAMNLATNAAALRFGETGGTGVIEFGSLIVINGTPVYAFDVLGGTLRAAAGTVTTSTFTQFATATNVSAGATLDFANGASAQVRNLQSAGTVNSNTASLTIGGGQSSGAITGTAGLVVATPATFSVGGNTGALVLSGTNSYTGNTTIQTGASLQLGNGGTAGSILGNVANSGMLSFNRSNAVTFGGVISGAGAVQQNGAGALTLTANNTYTGNTTVSAGSLIVNGSIAASSLTTVNAGTLLGGTGTIGNATINGGTLAAGNSIGTLSVQGNLVLTAASTYLVELSPSNADRTNVSGTAALGGATVSALFAAGSYVNKRYTILTANGGVTGTFGPLVNSNLPTNFLTSLSHDANNAYLDLTLDLTKASPTFGGALSSNQTNVANALVNSFNTAGGIPLAFATLTAQGLTQASGEAATGVQQTTFNVMDQFLNVMTDPFMGARSGGAANAGAAGYADDEALAYAGSRKGRTAAERDAYAKMAVKAPPLAATIERRWSVWGAGYGGTQATDGNAALGSSDVRARIYGGTAGLDYRLDPNTLVGFSLGGAGTNYNLAKGLGGGRSEIFQAGVYGRHHAGPAYITGALAWGWQDVTTDRVALLNSYRANFNASALSGRLEGGWRFALGNSGLTPYAAGQFTTFWLPNYAEQTVAGLNTFALAYTEKDVTASRSELGLRGDTSFAMQDAVVTLRGRAAWAHNFDTTRGITAVFQTLPASAFVVNGAAQARDSALVSAGAEARWLNGFSVAATFEGEFSKVTGSYAGKGILRYQW